MQNILSPQIKSALEKFLGPKTIFAFDFDGTLAPITARPECAVMRKTTACLINQLAEIRPTIVVSGRSRADVAGRMTGIPLFGIVGNHGMEADCPLGSEPDPIRSWIGILEKELAGMAGINIEDKRFSLSAHYRNAPDKTSARIAVERAAALCNKASLVGGKDVLNLLPENAPNKGDALLFLCASLGADSALFVGDDETDEDVFALTGNVPVFGVRVEPSERSAARYFIENQERIDEFLDLLIRYSKPVPNSLA